MFAILLTLCSPFEYVIDGVECNCYEKDNSYVSEVFVVFGMYFISLYVLSGIVFCFNKCSDHLEDMTDTETFDEEDDYEHVEVKSDDISEPSADEE